MSFSFIDRDAALASLRDNSPELLVIGGGVVGCSIAAHAARLGLNVLVVEKNDIASGASGNSTGLAHAGLRYLAQGRIGYVFREGRERNRLQEIAPQWVRPFNFVLPVYKTDSFPFWMVRLGTLIYDILGWADAFLSKRPLTRRHQVLTADQVMAKIPGIRTENLVGGVEYYVDAKLQDSRFTLGFAQQAAQHGARFITHGEVTSIIVSGDVQPRVTLRDALTGQDYQLLTPLVINASGAWIDGVRQKAGLGSNLVQNSKGIHLIVDPVAEVPLIMTSAVKGKVFFVIPLDAERTLIGTTDTAVSGNPDDVRPDSRDVMELLQQLFYFFPYLKQGPNLLEAIESYKQVHVRDVYWGIRPLLYQKGSTLHASREHRLTKELPRLWSFPGVKLTAGRAAGLEAALEAWQLLRPTSPIPAVDWDSLPGGELWDIDHFIQDAQRKFRLGEDSDKLLNYLISLYGTRYLEVQEFADREPHYAKALFPDEPWILAQVAYAVKEEMALTLNDFLWRRTKWAHLRDLPDSVLRSVAETMAHYLSWTEEEIDRQISDYKRELHDHRLS